MEQGLRLQQWTSGDGSGGSLSPWRCQWGSHVDCPACRSHLGCPAPSNACLKDPDGVRSSPIGRTLEHHTESSPKASKIGLGDKGWA